jgi:hypothetical protein
MQNARFRVEYATTGRAKCKAKACAHGNAVIGQGELRVARVVDSDRFSEGGTQTEWYHPRCLFEVFMRAKATSRKIESAADMDGVAALAPHDQAALAALIAEFVPRYKRAGATTAVAATLPLATKKRKTEETAATAITARDAAAPPLGVAVVSEDGRAVRLMGTGPHMIGRGEQFGVDDARCSRRQVELRVVAAAATDGGGGEMAVMLTARGVNSSCLYRGTDAPIVMKRDVAYPVAIGDQFALVAGRHLWTIQPLAAASTTSTTTSSSGGDRREMCMYGAQCARKNPKHFAEFQHPPGVEERALATPS